MGFQALDPIINETVQVIESSKEQILEIADNAQAEVDRVKAELLVVAQETLRNIKEVDQLTVLVHGARVRLMEVSRDFSSFTEEDIKASYENAQSLQIKLITAREQEKTLLFRREHVERSQKRLWMRSAGELPGKSTTALRSPWQT
jgi:two-component system sensor histidine kinase DegS